MTTGVLFPKRIFKKECEVTGKELVTPLEFPSSVLQMTKKKNKPPAKLSSAQPAAQVAKLTQQQFSGPVPHPGDITWV
jgi:hypothetical protein